MSYQKTIAVPEKLDVYNVKQEVFDLDRLSDTNNIEKDEGLESTLNPKGMKGQLCCRGNLTSDTGSSESLPSSPWSSRRPQEALTSSPRLVKDRSPRTVKANSSLGRQEGDSPGRDVSFDKDKIVIKINLKNLKKKRKKSKRKKYKKMSKKSKVVNKVSVNIANNLNYSVLGEEVCSSLRHGAYERSVLPSPSPQQPPPTQDGIVCIKSGVMANNRYSLRNPVRVETSQLSQKILELTHEKLHQNYNNSLFSNSSLNRNPALQKGFDPIQQIGLISTRFSKQQNFVREMLENSPVDNQSLHLKHLQDKCNNNILMHQSRSYEDADLAQEAVPDDEFIDINELQAFLPYEAYLKQVGDVSQVLNNEENVQKCEVVTRATRATGTVTTKANPTTSNQMKTLVLSKQMATLPVPKQMTTPVTSKQMASPPDTKQMTTPVTSKQMASPPDTKQMTTPIASKQITPPVTKEMPMSVPFVIRIDKSLCVIHDIVPTDLKSPFDLSPPNPSHILDNAPCNTRNKAVKTPLRSQTKSTPSHSIGICATASPIEYNHIYMTRSSESSSRKVGRNSSSKTQAATVKSDSEEIINSQLESVSILNNISPSKRKHHTRQSVEVTDNSADTNHLIPVGDKATKNLKSGGTVSNHDKLNKHDDNPSKLVENQKLPSLIRTSLRSFKKDDTINHDDIPDHILISNEEAPSNRAQNVSIEEMSPLSTKSEEKAEKMGVPKTEHLTKHLSPKKFYVPIFKPISLNAVRSQNDKNTLEESIDQISPTMLSEVVHKIQLEINSEEKQIGSSKTLFQPYKTICKRSNCLLNKSTIHVQPSDLDRDFTRAETSTPSPEKLRCSPKTPEHLVNISHVSTSSTSAHSLPDKISDHVDLSSQDVLFGALNIFKDQNFLPRSKMRKQNEVNSLLEELEKIDGTDEELNGNINARGSAFNLNRITSDSKMSMLNVMNDLRKLNSNIPDKPEINDSLVQALAISLKYEGKTNIVIEKDGQSQVFQAKTPVATKPRNGGRRKAKGGKNSDKKSLRQVTNAILEQSFPDNVDKESLQEQKNEPFDSLPSEEDNSRLHSSTSTPENIDLLDSSKDTNKSSPCGSVDVVVEALIPPEEIPKLGLQTERKSLRLRTSGSSTIKTIFEENLKKSESGCQSKGVTDKASLEKNENKNDADNVTMHQLKKTDVPIKKAKSSGGITLTRTKAAKKKSVKKFSKGNSKAKDSVNNNYVETVVEIHETPSARKEIMKPKPPILPIRKSKRTDNRKFVSDVNEISIAPEEPKANFSKMSFGKGKITRKEELTCAIYSKPIASRRSKRIFSTRNTLASDVTFTVPFQTDNDETDIAMEKLEAGICEVKDMKDKPIQENNCAKDEPNKEDSKTKDKPNKEERKTKDICIQKDNNTKGTPNKEDSKTKDKPNKEDSKTIQKDNNTKGTPNKEDSKTKDKPNKEDSKTIQKDNNTKGTLNKEGSKTKDKPVQKESIMKGKPNKEDSKTKDISIQKDNNTKGTPNREDGKTKDEPIQKKKNTKDKPLQKDHFTKDNPFSEENNMRVHAIQEKCAKFKPIDEENNFKHKIIRERNNKKENHNQNDSNAKDEPFQGDNDKIDQPILELNETKEKLIGDDPFQILATSEELLKSTPVETRRSKRKNNERGTVSLSDTFVGPKEPLTKVCKTEIFKKPRGRPKASITLPIMTRRTSRLSSYTQKDSLKSVDTELEPCQAKSKSTIVNSGIVRAESSQTGMTDSSSLVKNYKNEGNKSSGTNTRSFFETRKTTHATSASLSKTELLDALPLNLVAMQEGNLRLNQYEPCLSVVDQLIAYNKHQLARQGMGTDEKVCEDEGEVEVTPEGDKFEVDDMINIKDVPKPKRGQQEKTKITPECDKFEVDDMVNIKDVPKPKRGQQEKTKIILECDKFEVDDIVNIKDVPKPKRGQQEKTKITPECDEFEVDDMVNIKDVPKPKRGQQEKTKIILECDEFEVDDIVNIKDVPKPKRGQQEKTKIILECDEFEVDDIVNIKDVPKPKRGQQEKTNIQVVPSTTDDILGRQDVPEPRRSRRRQIREIRMNAKGGLRKMSKNNFEKNLPLRSLKSKVERGKIGKNNHIKGKKKTVIGKIFSKPFGKRDEDKLRVNSISEIASVEKDKAEVEKTRGKRNVDIQGISNNALTRRSRRNVLRGETNGKEKSRCKSSDFVISHVNSPTMLNRISQAAKLVEKTSTSSSNPKGRNPDKTDQSCEKKITKDIIRPPKLINLNIKDLKMFDVEPMEKDNEILSGGKINKKESSLPEVVASLKDSGGNGTTSVTAQDILTGMQKAITEQILQKKRNKLKTQSPDENNANVSTSNNDIQGSDWKAKATTQTEQLEAKEVIAPVFGDLNFSVYDFQEEAETNFYSPRKMIKLEGKELQEENVEYILTSKGNKGEKSLEENSDYRSTSKENAGDKELQLTSGNNVEESHTKETPVIDSTAESSVKDNSNMKTQPIPDRQLISIFQNLKTELKVKLSKQERKGKKENGESPLANIVNATPDDSPKPSHSLDPNVFNIAVDSKQDWYFSKLNEETVSEKWNTALLNSLKIKREQLKYFHARNTRADSQELQDVKADALLSCPLCVKIYRHAFRLKQHLKKCHSGDILECDCCTEYFYDRPAYDAHMASHDEGIHCRLCGEKYPKPAMRDHLVLHIREDQRTNLTDACFDRKQTYFLTHYLKKNHFKLQCHLCADTFCPRSNMLRHYLTKHSNEKIYYSCHRCDKRFSLLQNLKRHLAIHEGITYTCGVCDRTYSRLSDYKTHVKMHVGLKIQCPVCFKCTSRVSYLKKHMIMLHGRAYTDEELNLKASALR